ncbi:MAG: PqqD family protein [Solirubrobacteraceae bacterium]
MSEAAAWQIVEGRVVMLDLDAERYYRLDSVGSRMWELLSEFGDVESVHARLLAEYDVDASELRQDLEDFVTRLVAAGLVQVEPTRS